MTQHASGAFDVSIKPAAMPEKAGRTTTARMVLDKQYSGALLATGKGEMLTAVSDTEGSAAYVAIERISGTLNDRKGSFVVQHSGTMSGGAERMSIAIVPDSGTDQLSGIAGEMMIKIVGGKHFYELAYRLPQQ